MNRNINPMNTLNLITPEKEHISSTEGGTIIRLDIGGFKFKTFRSTLTRVPGSFFESMLSGRFAEIDDDGYYFIDRDGKHFRHVLNFLRSGTVLTLPKNDDDKKELAVEAEYYGLDDLKKAICNPQVDTTDFLPEEVLEYREQERKIRTDFCEGVKQQNSNPFESLLPLFDEDHGIRPLPIQYEGPSSKMRDSLFMARILDYEEEKNEGGSRPPVCVRNVDEFKQNFNQEHPNVLHRLTPVLLQEKVIIAGGSVLRALTKGSKIRASKHWKPEGQDIDMFLYCDSIEQAMTVSKQIFDALAADFEKWVVLRCRNSGVINIHQIAPGLTNEIAHKIQIILRIYNSPAEILLGFDVDCCCCAFDGKEVWVSPRSLFALKTGINILNPLHMWPNKASYELRLAKYATRGFPVFIPGIDKSRIDYGLIHNADKVSDLHGMARFLKVSAEMESHGFKELNNSRRVTTLSPRLVGPQLREEYENCATEDEKLLEFLNWGYDDLTCDVIVPEVYVDARGSGRAGDFMWWHGWGGEEWPSSRDSREEAWAEILECDDPPRGVPKRLFDSWQTEKLSREYLNGQMDQYDLDNVYYGHAYRDA